MASTCVVMMTNKQTPCLFFRETVYEYEGTGILKHNHDNLSMKTLSDANLALSYQFSSITGAT